jgi:hypothetical protein
MHDDLNPGGANQANENGHDREPEPTALERRLRSLEPTPLPDDLLDRCLATIDVAAGSRHSTS